VESPEISDMARSFYAETKRISNARAKAELDWRPKFQNYQTGLMSIYKSDLNQSEAVLLAGYLDIPLERRRAVKEALAGHIDLTRAEKGCLRFDLTYDPVVEGRLNVMEVFESPASFKAHQRRTEASDWTEVTRGLKRHYYKIG